MRTRKLQEAKAKSSDMVKETYGEVTKPKQTFVEFMQNSPVKGAELNIKRDKSLTRDIET